ncbi:MAG: hypothetical protein P1U74_05080 [Legionellaceae bacterium]|nr:hypothetical protein [Legionellaceae bacterium]
MFESQYDSDTKKKHEDDKKELFLGAKVQPMTTGDKSRQVIDRSRKAREEKPRLLEEQRTALNVASTTLENMSERIDTLIESVDDLNNKIQENTDEISKITDIIRQRNASQSSRLTIISPNFLIRLLSHSATPVIGAIIFIAGVVLASCGVGIILGSCMAVAGGALLVGFASHKFGLFPGSEKSQCEDHQVVAHMENPSGN